MPTPDAVPVVINGEQHDAHHLTLDYESGTMVVDISLAHLIGQDVTYRVGGYSGNAFVHAVEAPKDEPISTTLHLHGPAFREPA